MSLFKRKQTKSEFQPETRICKTCNNEAVVVSTTIEIGRQPEYILAFHLPCNKIEMEAQQRAPLFMCTNCFRGGYCPSCERRRTEYLQEQRLSRIEEMLKQLTTKDNQ